MTRKQKMHDPNMLYAVTLGVVFGIPIFFKSIYSNIVVDSLRFCQQNKKLEIFAYCLMPDHLHMVFRTGEGVHPSDFLRDMKKFTSSQIVHCIERNSMERRKDWLLNLFALAGSTNSKNKVYQFWQQHNHPVILDRNEIIDRQVNYIHQNPVKAGFVHQAHHWLHSSAGNYYNGDGILQVKLLLL